MNPNSEYIDKLSGSDGEFRARLIELLKQEWPLEVDEYRIQVKEQNWEKAGAAVHKLKHKISIFGLEDGYQVARELEYQYKENQDTPREAFDLVVEVITQYLDKL